MDGAGAQLFQAFLRGDSDSTTTQRRLRVRKRPFARREGDWWDVRGAWLEVNEALPRLAEAIDRRVSATAEAVCELPEDGFLPFRDPCRALSDNQLLVVTALGVYRRSGCLWIPVLNSSRVFGLSMCAYLYRSDRFRGCIRGSVGDRMTDDEYAHRMRSVLDLLPAGTPAWVRMDQIDAESVALGVEVGGDVADDDVAYSGRWRQLFLDGQRLIVRPLDNTQPTVRAVIQQLEALRSPGVAVRPVDTTQGDIVECLTPPVRVAACGADPFLCDSLIVGRYRHRSSAGALSTLFAVLVGSQRGPQLVTVAPPGDITFITDVPQVYERYMRDLLRSACGGCSDTLATMIGPSTVNRTSVALDDGHRRAKHRRLSTPPPSSPVGIACRPRPRVVSDRYGRGMDP
jgi:hypothetical protein